MQKWHLHSAHNGLSKGLVGNGLSLSNEDIWKHMVARERERDRERETETETETETEGEGEGEGRGERRASSWRIHRNPWNAHIFAFSKSNPESNRSLTRRLLRRWSKFQRKTYNHNATGRYVDASGLVEGATKKTARTPDYVNRKQWFEAVGQEVKWEGYLGIEKRPKLESEPLKREFLQVDRSVGVLESVSSIHWQGCFKLLQAPIKIGRQCDFPPKCHVPNYRLHLEALAMVLGKLAPKPPTSICMLNSFSFSATIMGFRPKPINTQTSFISFVARPSNFPTIPRVKIPALWPLWTWPVHCIVPPDAATGAGHSMLLKS